MKGIKLFSFCADKKLETRISDGEKNKEAAKHAINGLIVMVIVTKKEC